jgi:TatD DNase family protein
MRYFDAHCHVQFSHYDEDRTAVLASMREAGVGALVVGTDKSHSKQAVAVADGKTLFASVGLHPNDKPNEGYDDAYFRKLGEDPKVLAIGECGLDYFRPDEPGGDEERQRQAFFGQIRIAGEIKKPLVIHARPSKGTMDAYEDAYELLREAKREFRELRGDMHFFVGNTEIAKKYLELDFTFSFTAVITFARDYDEVIRYIPRTHLLSETDAPYVAPAPNRGRRNDPLAVREVVKALADIRGEDEEIVREATVENARGLFGLP